MVTLSDKTRRDLQWAQVLERIAHFCVTELAEQQIKAMQPLPEQTQAEYSHQLVRETMALSPTAPLPLQRFSAMEELWSHLAKGVSGNATQLRDTARLIEISASLRRYLTEHEEHCPTLKAELWTSSELDALGDELKRAIDDNAEIRDNASPDLHTARHRLATTRKRLRGSQQQLLKRYADALSGQFFAEREGRLVLPVRSDRIGSVPGIVFGSSSSGGTLYVEPNELTEPNNALRLHEAEVAQEEARVLAELSTQAGALLGELKAAQRACIKADCLRATSAWAAEARARPIHFAPDPVLSLKQMRHPLLIGADVVPNDIRLASGECLIISGPNAGGKTVAMKCLGLAVLLSASGLPLPIDEDSKVGWFEEVFTDIGDEQSLSRSLSTFSAHIQNIGAALEQVGSAAMEKSGGGATQRRVLVLLDELAGGTDPEEGSALAGALLTAFVDRGAAVCVTTHYEKLKQLGASDDSRFLNASVGFDLKQLRPTFHLSLGTPGASSAFAVAGRYGIPSAVIEHARQLLPQAQHSQEELIAQLEQERQRLLQAREQAESELSQQERLRRQLESDKQNAKEKERARLQKEAAHLTTQLKEARALLDQAKTALQRESTSKQALKEAEALVSRAAQPVSLQGDVTSALRPAQESGKAPIADELAEGQAVYLVNLQTYGEVVEPPKRDAVRVSVGGLKMSVPLSQLRLSSKRATKQNQTPKHRKPKGQRGASQAAASGFTPSRTSSNTCDLRGQRVEAGLDRVDEFIDEVLRRNESVAYILHGHGTGAMKSAVREHLTSSPHVTHWEVAPREDGGDALTLFWLRD